MVVFEGRKCSLSLAVAKRVYILSMAGGEGLGRGVESTLDKDDGEGQHDNRRKIIARTVDNGRLRPTALQTPSTVWLGVILRAASHDPPRGSVDALISRF